MRRPAAGEEIRCRAPRLDTYGTKLRRNARTLGLVHRMVANPVAADAAPLPDQPPQPAAFGWKGDCHVR